MKRKRGRSQTAAEIKQHVLEQVGFLQASAARFDAGHLAEAKRLATTLRVLLRDTRSSRSLLGQLGSDFQWRFVDSVIVPIERINDTSQYFSLMSIKLTSGPDGGSVGYEPLCYDAKHPRDLLRPFSDWWTRLVIRDVEGNRFSRENLVLAVADQDGGAHVDPEIDEAYAKLSRSHSLGFTFSRGGPEPREWTENPVPMALRQIAAEVLWSLERQGLASPGKESAP